MILSSVGRGKFLAAGLLLGAGTWLALVPIAASAASGGGGPWTYSANLDVLGNPSTYQVQGTADASGACHIPVTGSLSPGSAPVEQQVTAIQYGTCKAMVEEGTPQSPNSGASSTGSSTSGTQASLGTSPTGAAPAISEEGWVHGWYTDPLGIDVTGSVDYVSWTGNGTCVTGGGAGHNLGWDGGTGWAVQSNSTSSGYDCSDIWSQNITTFVNHVFCGVTDWTYFDPDWAHGHPAGNLTYYGNIYANGACHYLLSAHITGGFGSPPSP